MEGQETQYKPIASEWASNCFFFNQRAEGSGRMIHLVWLPLPLDNISRRCSGGLWLCFGCCSCHGSESWILPAWTAILLIAENVVLQPNTSFGGQCDVKFPPTHACMLYTASTQPPAFSQHPATDEGHLRIKLALCPHIAGR